MQTQDPFPVSIELIENNRVLAIGWDDGELGHIPLDVLRAACPCAVCCGHHPSQSLNLQPDQFLDVTILELAPVGRYAYNIVFSDRHATGIYTVEQLRRLSLAS